MQSEGLARKGGRFGMRLPSGTRQSRTSTSIGILDVPNDGLDKDVVTIVATDQVHVAISRIFLQFREGERLHCVQAGWSEPELLIIRAGPCHMLREAEQSLPER